MAEPYLTMAEIEAAYPNQWVILDRPRSDRYGNLLGGHVIASTPDREERDRQLEQLPPHLTHVATLHTGVRPFTVGPVVPFANRLLTCFVLVCLVAGAGWFGQWLTYRLEVPSEVRVFRSNATALESHADDVRSGRVKPEPDGTPNPRYPLSEDLWQAGIVACTVSDGIIWYHLPSGALDGGSSYLVTPSDRAESVGKLPGRLSRRTYHFTTLSGNWAYWFVLAG
jgi:hypothetical protein